MIFVVSILTSFLLGLLTCTILFKGLEGKIPRFLINVSIPIGIGISSVIFIAFNLLGVPTLYTVLIEIVLITYIFLKYGCFEKLRGYFKGVSLNEFTKKPILLLLLVVYCYSWILDVGVYYFDSVKEPHGLWDAWADWNLGSRMISRDPQNWPDSFHMMISEDFHTDYPLLQKGFIARCWILLKNETLWIPILFSFVITFCTIGLVSASVSYFKGKVEGLVAGLVLLCTPFFMVMGDSQYADNTVGYFFLASIVLLTMSRKGSEINPGLLIASGLSAGLAAWSKNEGLLFIVCLIASQMPLLFLKNFKELISEVKYLVLGILPVLILIIYQKIAISPPNQIIVAQGDQTWIKLADINRYKTIWTWYVDQFVAFGQWAFNPWWLFLFGVIFMGGISVKKYNYSFISNFTWFIFMLIGFFMVEVITPLDLVFYLSTSIHRLFSQLFPSFIFIYFIALKDEPVMKINKSKKQNVGIFKDLKFFKFSGKRQN